MKLRIMIWVSVVAIIGIALTATIASASTTTIVKQSASSLLRRCENDYSQEEIDAMLANGEDSYEPDDCPALAHVLTGPMLFNFCQLGDEDWIKFNAKSGMIYQIKAEAQGNFPTEPHLELYDDGGLIAQNDHYFGNNAEIWWWNAGADRMVYLRAIELRGRADCGNSEYTLSLHSFTDKP